MNGAAANGAMDQNQAQNATEQLGAAEAGNMMQEQAQNAHDQEAAVEQAQMEHNQIAAQDAGGADQAAVDQQVSSFNLQL